MLCVNFISASVEKGSGPPTADALMPLLSADPGVYQSEGDEEATVTLMSLSEANGGKCGNLL